MTLLILWTAWPYVSASFRILEGSRETSGIPFVYLLKAEILVFAALLTLQGLSTVIRSLLVLTGRAEHVEVRSAALGGGH